MKQLAHPDLVIFGSKPPDTAFPIVIGEIKTAHWLESNFEYTCYQLLYYQLAVQRPLLRSSSDSHQILLGFVMDAYEAAIIELTVNSWISKRPLDPIQIEMFNVRNSDERIKFFSMLLLRVRNALTNDDAFQRLTKPLFLFGQQIGKIKDINHDNQCIMMTSSSLLEPFVQRFNKSPDSLLIFPCEEEEQKLILPPNTNLVIKVFGELFSGGMYGDTLLLLLLKSAHRRKLRERLHWLYVALFKVVRSHPFRFAITRLVSGTVCSDSRILDLWKKPRKVDGKLLLYGCL